MQFLVDIDDDLGKRVKMEIIDKYGKLRGHVSKVFEEGLRLWLQNNDKEDKKDV
jgi:hypothetical protein